MNFALNSALSHFKQRNGELLIGDRAISSLAQEHGTPLYIYDRAVIKRRCQSLRDVLPSNLNINYAVKANPNSSILKIMGELYDGFDIASQGEMEKAIEAGISPGLMSFTGPGKSIDELKFAIENEIGTISVESEPEVEHIKNICKSLDTSAKILIRVNSDFELNQSGMKMGGGPKQFGIDSERVPALIKTLINDMHLQFDGIHIFSGSQNLHADQLLQTYKKIIEYSYNLSFSENINLKTINIGGGFGIPYFAHEEDLDLTSVANGLKQLLDEYNNKLPKTVFKIELGRYLVGECGIYVSRILYRKISHGKTFLITNGGMHHHLAASGNFGQSIVRRPMPLTIVNKLNNDTKKAHIVGPLCTPLDTFGAVDVPQADEGDLVAVFNSGAYGFSASPIGFLSHKIPEEVIV
jgi:diaminopimelate decarboxylase